MRFSKINWLHWSKNWVTNPVQAKEGHKARFTSRRGNESPCDDHETIAMETREAEREKFDKKTRRTEHLSERILKGQTRDFGIGTVSSDPDGGLQHLLQKSKTRRVGPVLRHEGRRDASHSIRGRSTENNVFIFQMPEIPNLKPEPDVNIPRYVHACLDLMYCTCTSPYERSRKAQVDKTKCEYALHTIQKVSNYIL